MNNNYRLSFVSQRYPPSLRMEVLMLVNSNLLLLENINRVHAMILGTYT